MCAGVLRGGDLVQRGRAALPGGAHPLRAGAGPHLRERAQRVHQAAPPHRQVGARRAALRRALDPRQRVRLRER